MLGEKVKGLKSLAFIIGILWSLWGLFTSFGASSFDYWLIRAEVRGMGGMHAYVPPLDYYWLGWATLAYFSAFLLAVIFLCFSSFFSLRISLCLAAIVIALDIFGVFAFREYELANWEMLSIICGGKP